MPHPKATAIRLWQPRPTDFHSRLTATRGDEKNANLIMPRNRTANTVHRKWQSSLFVCLFCLFGCCCVALSYAADCCVFFINFCLCVSLVCCPRPWHRNAIYSNIMNSERTHSVEKQQPLIIYSIAYTPCCRSADRVSIFASNYYWQLMVSMCWLEVVYLEMRFSTTGHVTLHRFLFSVFCFFFSFSPKSPKTASWKCWHWPFGSPAGRLKVKNC